MSTAIRGAAPLKAPKMPTVPMVSISSNDPVMRIAKQGDNAFTIRGVASNHGAKKSVLNVTLGAKTVSIPLLRGKAPSDIAKALKTKLPKGYKMKVEGLGYKPGPGARQPVLVTITQAKIAKQ